VFPWKRAGMTRRSFSRNWSRPAERAPGGSRLGEGALNGRRLAGIARMRQDEGSATDVVVAPFSLAAVDGFAAVLAPAGRSRPVIRMTDLRLQGAEGPRHALGTVVRTQVKDSQLKFGSVTGEVWMGVANEQPKYFEAWPISLTMLSCLASQGVRGTGNDSARAPRSGSAEVGPSPANTASSRRTVQHWRCDPLVRWPSRVSRRARWGEG
jgi:hypothetical protein